MSKNYTATLVYGQNYMLGDRWFVAGKPQTVDGDTKNYLESTAFDVMTVEGSKPLERQKFSFVEVGTEVVDEAVAEEATNAPATATSRSRSRSPRK